tara:strand:- start:140 stop:1459 length:1320 start_codon:yes stop_codon:yes gene_type:complete
VNRFNKDFFFRFFLNLQFILIIFTIIFFSCNQKHEPEIAQIDGDIITLNVYLTRYQTFLSKTHQTDNLSNRYNLLNLLIDEAIIMEYAEEKGISEKIEKSPQMEKDKNQLLLNTFYKQEIKPKLIAGETELRRMYTWSKSSIHVRHLFSRTKQGILDIQNQLNSGDSWEKIALNCFTDPLLSSNGGDLGFRKLGELDPAFEEVAFQLTDGEISPPVMTGDGYSIIQLLEREYDPFLIENDYLLMKDRLDIIAKIYKKRPAVREYTDRVYNQLRLVFNHKNLLQLLSEIKSLKGEESVEIKSASPDLTIVKSLSLKTYWTSADILEKCRTLSQEKIARMNSVENAESIISGLFVREMLLKKAVESNLHHDADFMKQVDELKRKHIVQSIFYGIKNPDTEHDDSFRFNAFQDFIESLRKESDINIDSTVVKSFILEKRMYI